MPKKRPVYLVVKVMGLTKDGEKIVTILDIKQTSHGADQEAAKHQDGEVVKGFISY